jgi:lipoyl synthase
VTDLLHPPSGIGDRPPANGAGVKHKGGAKTARIPIRIIEADRLRKPEWIRVRAPSSPRF